MSHLRVNLEGQRILVTGASRGIGKALAESLLEQGATVAIHYNSNRQGAGEVLKKDLTGRSAIFRADMASEEQVNELFERSLAEMGGMDTLVINAGIFLPHPPELSQQQWMETWRKTLAVNLDAAGLLTYKAINHFKANQGGRIIYIGSRAAFRGETREYLAYAASKGGLTALARSVARAYGKDDIKAFVVAPGFTRTEMAESFIAEYGEERVLNEIALNELTRPQDLAPLVALLCSGLMDHATGTTIDVNAGSYMH